MIRRSTFLASVAGGLAAAALPAYATESARHRAPAVVLGDDTFVASTWRELAGRTVGIVTNQSGVLSTGEPLVDAAHRNPAIKIKALFGPEHGIRGVVGAGEHVDSSTDERTGLPVYSLYGATRHPTKAMLDGIDVLLFDIQDVGARAYTYISTMAYVMEAAAQYGKDVWVLDRPNPIGGTLVEGPILEPAFKSFVGLYPIPERHGMTIGELARMFNDHFHIGCRLRVIPMQGWSRSMVWAQTGLNWVATSPNMPYAKTTLVYLATGLVDEAGINNGVGTAKPFEYAGTYGMQADAFASALNARAIPGVTFRPATWTPERGFWAGKTLSGVEIDVTDPHAFPSVRTAVELMTAARDLSPTRTLPIHSAATMDRDWGTARVRGLLLEGASADAIVRSWDPGLRAFNTARTPYLLY